MMMHRLTNGSSMIFKVKISKDQIWHQDYKLKVSEQQSYLQLEGTPREVLDDILSWLEAG